MTDAHPNAVPDARIAIEVDADPCVNFALQQNRVPFVKRIRVTNCGAKTLEGVAVRVSMDPALADPICLRVDSIAPGSVVSFATVDFPLSSARLVQQTERESGVLRVEACLDDKVVSRELRPVEVLAYSEWPGTRSLPEILAAFVLPNHPIVQQILRAAAESLRSSTGDGALSGYQSRSRERVLAMARALYSAFSEMDIQYISPPASFESTGQKVRTPDQISTTRLGTCLDLTLLFAAALEQAGLHPILVLPRGHALVGVWLDDEAFPHPTVDDVTRIRKRVALGQIVTLETTLVTARPLPPFDEAVRAGSRHLEDGDKFHLAVDVRAARKALIRPLPARIDANARDLAPTPSIVHDLSSTGSEVERLVAVDPIAEEPDSPKKESGPARLERWKRRLLDLGLRNRLLNHRDTKTSIPLLCVSLAGLEDKLAGGSVFELHPEPEVLGPSDPRSAALFPTGAGHRASYLQTELDALRLHSSLGADELESRLTQLFRASRETLEEGGANTLFIALGFLRWFETKSSTQPRLAPLLLLPLQLERRTVVEGFRLKLADEDAQFNVTLLQKLAVDFGLNVTGLDALDEDDAGIDVAKILNRMRRAVLSLDRWEVVEEASIGLFSFTKYLMWRDLDKRTEKLLGHPVVRHLIETPDRPFAPETRFPDVERLDVERSPTSTFCPLDADSSQLRAIYAAADGATFVLEGPPGTGKSQTITNLIANAVAAGQRVLFVSEKMAALNVVHKRLSQVGLAPYCLELHSSKAQKRGVMAQLKAAVDSAAPGATTDWASAGAKLQTVRGELNAYADALHRRRSVGISAHEGIGRLMELRDAPVVDVAFGSLEAVDAGRLTTLREGAHSLQLAACDVEGLAASPWRGTGVQHWEPSLPERIRRIAEELVRAAGAVESASAEFATALGLPGDGLSARGVAQVAEIGRLLAASPGTPKGLLETSDLDSTRRQVTAWLELAAQQRERVARVRKSWRLEVLDLDLASLREELVRANRSVAPLGWWRARGARRTLASMWASTDRVPVRTVLVGVIDELLECRLGREHLSAAHAGARQVLDSGWRGIDTDETAIRAQLAWSDSFQRVLSRAFSSSGERVGDARSRWIELVTQQRDLLANDGALGRKLRALEDAISVLAAQVSSAARLVSMDESDLVGPADAAGYAARVAEVARGWVSGLPQLRRWCAWRRARAQAMDGGLGAIVAAIEDGRIEPRDVERSFDRSFLEAWLGALFRSDRELGDFSRTAHEDKIRRFRNLDMHVVETAHEVVAARLAARVPRGTMELSGQSTSEMGILHRELGRQRGHTPLRKLLQRIPNVMTRLKPCFLMSPLSVAQYLDVDFPAFDIVVFDEASQIPVWDAVGAIARGTRLIVVGDSRQLPPTNFFGKVDDEELTDESEVQDLDNILDECRVARIPRLELKWHYRSRHESLIAFSNFNYYENRLLTFPSAQLASTNLGVVWRHVPNGVYDRGRSRSNLAEAEAVVAHVVARLEDPTLSAKSIGIVTFSIAQQALVEDLLDEARRTHPSIEPYFSGEREEPVFVKNLENVQGDERDVILFSVCYGPDRDQNVGVNFGPLNRDGGERRLNVAITRARETLVVFSTLRSEQIDLSRSRSIGVRHLKDFLDYAHRGPVALGGGLDVSSLAECESPFEEDVRRTLVERGWEVQPQVGCSGYRVDLGVKDPDAPGRFLLGIECDGAMYHSGKTARDRDRLRQAVLEGLGWRIHRVWSTDWWHAKDEETTRLLAALAESRRPQTDGRNQGEARGGGGGYAQRTLRECAGGCSPIKRGLATPSVEPGRVGWRFPLQGCGCEHAAADHGQSGGVLRDNIRRGNRVADRGRSAYRGAH